MSKIVEFLTELEEELIYLKPKDAGEVLKFYREKINVMVDYGDDEDKIIASLPKPKKIAEDIYKSKGKTFLESRKKQVNRTSKFKAVFYTLLILIIAISLFSITAFFALNIYQLGRLFVLSFSMVSLIDKLSLALFILLYIFILIIALVYIFDLLYIMACHFLYPVLLEVKKNSKDKEFKFLSFTITGFIEEKSKKKNLVSKVLIGLVCGLLVFGIVNFVSKGYMYRSSNNDVELKEDIKVLGIFEEIIIEESTTFVKVKQDTVGQVTIKYYNEFNNKLSYTVDSNKLIIHPIKLSTFDLFGFLDEPLSTIEIIIPMTMDVKIVDINLNSGYFDIVDFNKKIDFKFSGNNSTFALTRSTINNLYVEGNNLNIASEENNISDVTLKLEDGRFCSVKDTYQSLVVENHLADFILQNANVNNININASSAKTALDKITSNELTMKDVNSESLLQDIVSENIKIISYANSETSLERLVATKSIECENASSKINLSFIKTQDLIVNTKRGHFNMYYINKDTITNDEAYEKYNTYKMILNLQLDMYLTDMEMISSNIDNTSIKVEEGTFDITGTYIKESQIYLQNTTMRLIDVDGVTMNLDVNGGIFSFDNENIKSNIIVYVTGELIKTDIYISDDIKQGETN